MKWIYKTKINKITQQNTSDQLTKYEMMKTHKWIYCSSTNAYPGSVSDPWPSTDWFAFCHAIAVHVHTPHHGHPNSPPQCRAPIHECPYDRVLWRLLSDLQINQIQNYILQHSAFNHLNKTNKLPTFVFFINLQRPRDILECTAMMMFLLGQQWIGWSRATRPCCGCHSVRLLFATT